MEVDFNSPYSSSLHDMLRFSDIRSNSSLSGMCSAYCVVCYYDTPGDDNDILDYTIRQASNLLLVLPTGNILVEYHLKEKPQTQMTGNS